jgi:predicted NBD/HSP70 family sugar kinase
LQNLDTIGNVQLMQKINRLKVLNLVRQRGPAARPEIARVTGLSTSSVTNIVGFLLEKDLLVEVGQIEKRDVGRKATLLKYNPSACLVVCIDIGANGVRIALTDLAGKARVSQEVLLDHPLMDREMLDLVRREVGRLVEESRTDRGAAIAGIGIAISGLVLNDDRLVVSSSMHWKSLPLKALFEAEFGLPVFVQNNSLTKAHWRLHQGMEEDERHVVFMDLAMGVGIIDFYDRQINESVIGELGHTTVQKDGPPCFCGNHGCLELLCSVEAVLRQCREALDQGRCPVLRTLREGKETPLDFAEVKAAAARGDADVQAVLRTCGEFLGIGLANVINLFNPQRIIINGDQLLTEDSIYRVAVEEARSRVNELFAQTVRFEKVDVGPEESIQGIALFLADRIFELGSSSTFLG